MKSLGVYLALCALLSLSHAIPVHSNDSMHMGMGMCEYKKNHGYNDGEKYVCDEHGNFLPQQCCQSTGYCWCVDIMTGYEIPNTRVPPGITPQCDKEACCPYGWSRYGKYCYIFIDTEKTWVEAEHYCLFEEANLASIHSYEECHFIQGVSKGYTHDFPKTWIGGHDAVQCGFWMWNDGSPFYFNNFCPDYKMDYEKRCLVMNYGYELKWNSASCNETYPFICSKMM